MATFKRFEDIHAWQKSRQVTRKIYEVTATDRFARDFRAARPNSACQFSIMANIAEGYGRHTDKDFANFLSIAHASVSEVQSHLYVALDLAYVSEKLFTEVYGLLDEVSRMTLVLARHLRRAT